LDKQDSSDEKNSQGRKLRLRELAAEASRHLDDILPGGDRLSENERSVQPEQRPASEGSVSSSTVGSGRAPSFRAGGAGGVASGSATPDAASGEAARGAGGALEMVRGLGRAPVAGAGEGVGKPRALVVHVSFGMATLLANILNRMGFHTRVATGLKEIESLLDGRDWDLLCVQGTSTPYPGKKLASAVLSRCTGSRPRIVLISRPGDSLLPEAGAAGAVGLIQWPFLLETIRKTLAEVLPAIKGRARDRG
jgi:hypothetical protein